MRYNYFTAHIMPEMRCDAMRCDAMRPAMRPGRQRSLEPCSHMASVSSVRFNTYSSVRFKLLLQAYVLIRIQAYALSKRTFQAGVSIKRLLAMFGR